jgi:hypothetical protein
MPGFIDFSSFGLVRPNAQPPSNDHEKGAGFPCPMVNGFGKYSVKQLKIPPDSSIKPASQT